LARLARPSSVIEGPRELGNAPAMFIVGTSTDMLLGRGYVRCVSIEIGA
jgi:hypothetical protein